MFYLLVGTSTLIENIMKFKEVKPIVIISTIISLISSIRVMTAIYEKRI